MELAVSAIFASLQQPSSHSRYIWSSLFSAIFVFTFSNQVLTPDIYGAHCFRHLWLHFQQPSSHSRYIWSSLFPPSLASLSSSATKFSLQIYIWSSLELTKCSNSESVSSSISYKSFKVYLYKVPIVIFDSVNQSYTRFPLHHFRRRRSISAMTYFFTYFF